MTDRASRLSSALSTDNDTDTDTDTDSWLGLESFPAYKSIICLMLLLVRIQRIVLCVALQVSGSKDVTITIGDTIHLT